jgi:hypothetical protein
MRIDSIERIGRWASLVGLSAYMAAVPAGVVGLRCS